MHNKRRERETKQSQRLIAQTQRYLEGQLIHIYPWNTGEKCTFSLKSAIPAGPWHIYEHDKYTQHTHSSSNTLQSILFRCCNPLAFFHCFHYPLFLPPCLCCISMMKLGRKYCISGLESLSYRDSFCKPFVPFVGATTDNMGQIKNLSFLF